MRNFQKNPDLVSEFEYLFRLSYKRINTDNRLKIRLVLNRMVWVLSDVKFSGESRSGVRI